MTADEQPTVLIVEDEENVAESYKLYLQQEYEVEVANNGGEAIVKLDPSVDVVLLDRRMPGMSGDEVLEHIQDWEFSCRVAMVTAVDPSPDIAEMSFDDYLSKPVGKDELHETVEQLLALDRYEEVLSEYNSVVKTYARLKAHLDQRTLSDSDTFTELEQRREELRAEINDAIDDLDDEMAAVFRQAHHTG